MTLDWLTTLFPGKTTLTTIVKMLLEMKDRWEGTDGRLDRIESRLDRIELSMDKSGIERFKKKEET